MGGEIGRIRPTNVVERAGESRMTPPAVSISSQVRPRISFLRGVPLGQGHLRLLVREYVEHYDHERNHQGRDNPLLPRAPPPARSPTHVRRRERVGGLLSFYYRDAA